VALLGGGAFLLAAVYTGLVLVPGWFGTGDDESCDCHYSMTLGEIVARADVIVVGTPGETRMARVPAAGNADGKPAGDRGDVLRDVRVEEVLKRPAGESLPAELPVSVGADADREIDAGHRYLFFLTQTGDEFGINGIPSVAAVADSGALSFIVSDAYLESARARGRISADGHLPFTATLTDVRSEVAHQATISYFPERVTYYSVADLVSGSSHIVIATYLNCTIREERPVSPGTGLVTDDIAAVAYQRFEVVETLKGSISPGEIQEVASASVSYEAALDGKRPAHVVTYEVLSPVEGEQYVLFLRSGPLDPNEPDAWGFAGEPGMATADEDGTLEFLLTEGFEHELRAMGLRVPPFTATLDEIRAEIARPAAAPSRTPGTPAPEPTPAKTVPSNP